MVDVDKVNADLIERYPDLYCLIPLLTVDDSSIEFQCLDNIENYLRDYTSCILIAEYTQLYATSVNSFTPNYITDFCNRLKCKEYIDEDDCGMEIDIPMDGVVYKWLMNEYFYVKNHAIYEEIEKYGNPFYNSFFVPVRTYAHNNKVRFSYLDDREVELYCNAPDYNKCNLHRYMKRLNLAKYIRLKRGSDGGIMYGQFREERTKKKVRELYTHWFELDDSMITKILLLHKIPGKGVVHCNDDIMDNKLLALGFRFKKIEYNGNIFDLEFTENSLLPIEVVSLLGDKVCELAKKNTVELLYCILISQMKWYILDDRREQIVKVMKRCILEPDNTDYLINLQNNKGVLHFELNEKYL